MSNDLTDEERKALKDALVAELTKNGDRHNTPCQCASCECDVRLTMPSEWTRQTCIFCHTNEHSGVKR